MHTLGRPWRFPNVKELGGRLPPWRRTQAASLGEVSTWTGVPNSATIILQYTGACSTSLTSIDLN